MIRHAYLFANSHFHQCINVFHHLMGSNCHTGRVSPQAPSPQLLVHQCCICKQQIFIAFSLYRGVCWLSAVSHTACTGPPKHAFSRQGSPQPANTPSPYFYFNISWPAWESGQVQGEPKTPITYNSYPHRPPTHTKSHQATPPCNKCNTLTQMSTQFVFARLIVDSLNSPKQRSCTGCTLWKNARV